MSLERLGKMMKVEIRQLFVVRISKETLNHEKIWSGKKKICLHLAVMMRTLRLVHELSAAQNSMKIGNRNPKNESCYSARNSGLFQGTLH